jgi:hypothetical protein
MDRNYIPYYRSYPIYDVISQSDDDRRDVDYIKRLYPKTFFKMQELVEEECDKMEYDGSLMYDEYPDKMLVGKICDNIYKEVKYIYEDNNEFAAAQLGRPCLNNGWCNDIIQILLLNEFYKRRCRRRNCRRWYW